MENSSTSKEFVDRVYRYMKNDMSIETFMEKFNVTKNELKGLLELCRLYGKDINIERANDTYVFKKNTIKTLTINKKSIDDPKLIHNQICVVSDTHFGNIHNQIHLLNEIYREAYNRGITIVLHVGDMTDGNYPNRPESPRQQFLHGFDEQVGYVAEMYPEIDGIITYYILGSHDETHYKNGQATVNKYLDMCRGRDMRFLGQDTGEFIIDNVRIVLDHPGGGSAKSLSYKPQQRIERLESHNKPNALLIGHFHKSSYDIYRNVHCVQVPALCATTQFQQKQGLSNYLGAYFLDIYSDKNGNIEYFEPEEILFGHNDIWDECGKDKKKVKKLEIKKGIY